MILKEIGRKIAQAFRLAKAADEKVTSSIATSLDTIAEQAKEYENASSQDHRSRVRCRKQPRRLASMWF